MYCGLCKNACNSLCSALVKSNFVVHGKTVTVQIFMVSVESKRLLGTKTFQKWMLLQKIFKSLNMDSLTSSNREQRRSIQSESLPFISDHQNLIRSSMSSRKHLSQFWRNCYHRYHSDANTWPLTMKMESVYVRVYVNFVPNLKNFSKRYTTFIHLSNFSKHNTSGTQECDLLPENITAPAKASASTET